MVEEAWRFLIQDVPLAGGFQSPMLSWLGAAGILALCLWHGVMLIRGTLHLRRAFERARTGAARLAGSRLQRSDEWIVIPSLAKHSTHPAEGRRDLDDLEQLDRLMRAEPILAGEWLSYRKTLAIEQAAWFTEPRVYAQRAAADVFSFDSVCANHLNMRLYHQLPSFLTGIGLMFTFLAILVGLSKLHATGSQIDGMQGLINGLAGKFVTSIVGLACSNAFMLLEKSLWYRLAGHHRAAVSLLDEMFPQKVLDQSLAGSLAPAATMSTAIRTDPAHQQMQTVQQQLQSTVAALTTVSQSLAALNRPQSIASRDEKLAADIGHEMQKALRPLLDPLMVAIRDLSHSANRPVELTDAERDSLFDRLRQHRASGSALSRGRTGTTDARRSA
ncbi:MAG: hypothetical protein ICV75_05300 [Nitrospiraceae bacterium]|nr:hypothetical protein [Nitrospiraceae bacterium]